MILVGNAHLSLLRSPVPLVSSIDCFNCVMKFHWLQVSIMFLPAVMDTRMTWYVFYSKTCIKHMTVICNPLMRIKSWIFYKNERQHQEWWKGKLCHLLQLLELSLHTRCHNFLKPAREPVKATLSNIFSWIIKHKASNGGKLPYRTISIIVADNKGGGW